MFRRVALGVSVAALLAVPVVAQNTNLAPGFGTLNLSANFSPDPRVVNVTAGGPIQASRVGARDCVGSIADAPDVRLNYRAGGLPLYISATSRQDVTLVINLPNGQWICNDDFRGTDPGVILRNPASGQYDIWVGTYERALVPAQLRISEVLPN